MPPGQWIDAIDGQGIGLESVGVIGGACMQSVSGGKGWDGRRRRTQHSR
jgi:hypothetical protein